MKALAVLGIAAYAVAVWLLLSSGGMTAFLLALAVGTACIGLAVMLRAMSGQHGGLPGADEGSQDHPAAPVEPIQPAQPGAAIAPASPDPDTAGHHESPLLQGDPATADEDLADLHAAVTLLRNCSPTERARIEAANEPVGVDDIADVFEGAGIDEYADAHAAWQASGMTSPEPGVDPDLARAAREVLALSDEAAR